MEGTILGDSLGLVDEEGTAVGSLEGCVEDDG